MNQPQTAVCNLCWSSGKLSGEEVIAQGEYLYAYLRLAQDGSALYGLIVAKDHHAGPDTLPGDWGSEFGRFVNIVKGAFPEASFNCYWNDGDVAGQTVLGHWHVRVEPRYAGRPSSFMGLGLLITKYDRLVDGLRELAASDHITAKKLKDLLKGTVITK